MNNRNEKNFKNALKKLVTDEPQKLAFFDSLEANDTIPPFIPHAEAEPKSTPERKRLPVAGKRRSYGFGMGAAAACFVLFLSLNAVTNSLGTFDNPAPADAENASLAAQDAAPPEAAALSPLSDEQKAAPEDVTGAAAGALEEADDAATPSDAADSGDRGTLQTAPPDATLAAPQASPDALARGADAGHDSQTGGISGVLFPICALACAAVFLLFLILRKRSK